MIGGSIHLCRATYSVAAVPEQVSIELFCQSVVLDACAYAWVDGINFSKPVLVPVEQLHGFQRAGTLGQYLRDERHIELGADYDDFLGLCLGSHISATQMVRACEFMHSDGLSPKDAIEAAAQWGRLLLDMDWQDHVRHSFSVVTH